MERSFALLYMELGTTVVGTKQKITYIYIYTHIHTHTHIWESPKNLVSEMMKNEL